MKVVLCALGKFHHFDLARELDRHGHLEAVFTGYPRFKLRGEGIHAARIDSFPYLQAPYMALSRYGLLSDGSRRAWEYAAKLSFDAHAARTLPSCDVLVGLSGSASRTGREARRRGARWVCDRGSTHIRTQDEWLREEHERWGLPFAGIDPRMIEREEAEYAEADCITVPSSVTRDSFIARGIPAAKVRRVPYGVNLSRFHPQGTPDADSFDLLFVGGMSLRKGIPYLLQAYARLQHPRKTLSFAGSVAPDLVEHFTRRGLWPQDARLLGHVPQPQLKALMSRSHVLVLPSIEEGLALVQAQAMACACVVVASRNTGAEDLFDDGEEGFIVPARDSDALAMRLQQLVDDPGLRRRMGERSLARVRHAGGWAEYGQQAVATYRSLLA